MRITITATIILSLLVGVNAIDASLSQSEEKILYSHVKTPSELEGFYRKILQSNGIDDPVLIENFITENDVAGLHVEHKVRITKHSLRWGNAGVCLVFQLEPVFATSVQYSDGE